MPLPKWLDEPLDFIYANFLDRPVKRLRFYVSEIESPRLPEVFDGTRVMHLSDLHAKDYGRNYSRLVKACRRHKPDIIVFTGDIFSRNESVQRIMTRIPMMRELVRLAPVFYIPGNHENDAPAKAEILFKTMSGVGVQVLRNDRVQLSRGGEHIDIYGLELPPDCYTAPDGGHRHLRRLSVGELDDMLGRPDSGSFNLLLAHSPIQFKEYAGWGADLTMSGHMHGGIIRILGKGLLSPERRFFPKYTKGVYRRKSGRGISVLEVSAGLGKFRINNPESVPICVLRRQRK